MRRSFLLTAVLLMFSTHLYADLVKVLVKGYPNSTSYICGTSEESLENARIELNNQIGKLKKPAVITELVGTKYPFAICILGSGHVFK